MDMSPILCYLIFFFFVSLSVFLSLCVCVCVSVYRRVCQFVVSRRLLAEVTDCKILGAYTLHSKILWASATFWY